MQMKGHFAYYVQCYQYGIIPTSTLKFSFSDNIAIKQKKIFHSLLLLRSICVNQVKGHSAHFVQHGQHGITAKHLTKHKVLFWCDVVNIAAIIGS